MTQPILINGIDEYTKYICKLNDGDKTDEYLRRKVYLFRGQPNVDYELLPSLARYNKYKKEKSGRIIIRDFLLHEIERNLIENAKFRLPNVFSRDLLPIELLSLLQHHGIPTRLLDVTENALVALYFACVSDFEIDGEVIIFLSRENQIYNPPIINAIADTYRLIKASYCTLHTFFQRAVEFPYFLEQKLEVKDLYKTDLEGANWVEECCKELMFIYSPIRTQRQQAQQGRYILFPNKIGWYNEKKNIKAFHSEIEPISKDHECIAMRLIVPAKQKKDLLEDLKLHGISKASLFPDNIDKVCEEIKETDF